MIEWLQIALVPLAAVAVVLRTTERKVLRKLQSIGATSKATATELPRIPRLGRWQLSRLERSSAVVPVGNDRYYFDPVGYRSFRGRRRRRAAIVVPILFVTVLILWYFSQ